MAVDLDERGEVVGIESVGCREITIHGILERADVQAPSIDFSRAKIVPTELVPA